MTMKTLLIVFVTSTFSWADYRQVLGKDGQLRTDIIQRIEDTAYIPSDIKNADYKEYLQWVEKGNVIKNAIVPVPVEPSKDILDAKDKGMSADKRLDALIKVLGF
jgi:hypothetical protein